MKNFTDKVAFVTGGASGIGLGMVRNFLAEGMKVVLADWNDDHLGAARALLKGNNAAHFIKVNVADRDDLRHAAQETLDVFGKIHVLCNNAGVGGGNAVNDPDFEAWDRALSVNLGGVVNGVKIIAPIIEAQGEGGHIVNTSSMAGMVPLPDFGTYQTAKFAVRGLSESLRMSLAPHGIGVSCLCPGAVKTALLDIPADDSAVPEDENGDYATKLRAAMRASMDPMELGAIVVQAIRDNRFYILAHREFLDEMIDRHRKIEAAFLPDDTIPEARRVFETHRRESVDRLFAMPAKD